MEIRLTEQASKFLLALEDTRAIRVRAIDTFE